MSFDKGMYYRYKHIFACIHIPLDKHILHTNIESNHTWNVGMFSYKAHCTGGNDVYERNKLILLLVSVLHSFCSYFIIWINIKSLYIQRYILSRWHFSGPDICSIGTQRNFTWNHIIWCNCCNSFYSCVVYMYHKSSKAPFRH